MSKKHKNFNSTPSDELENDKDQKKDPEGSLISPSLKLQLLIALTCFATVAASYGVQYYRERFVIPPQKEKSFPYLLKTSSNSALRNVAESGSLLRFINFDKNKPLEYNIKLFESEEQLVKIENLDFYEYWNSDVYTGGKVTFKYLNLISSITYLFKENMSVEILIDCTGKNDPGLTSTNRLVISTGSNDSEVVNIQHDTKLFYQIFETHTNIVNSEDAKDIEEKLNEMKTSWERKFDLLFQLSNKRMPKPYQDIAESALAFAVNSLRMNKTVKLMGTYDKNFELKTNFFYLQSPHFPLKSLDEQIFPLIVMSKINAEDTLRILQSWISTLNEHGEMLNQISDGLLQLGKTQTPMLFQLLKEVLSNHLFEGKLNAHVKNIEEIAENTWKNSIGNKGLNQAKWLGNSRGIFQLEPRTREGEGSYQLVCLLEDMCKVMQELNKQTGIVNQKWIDRSVEAESVRVTMKSQSGRDSHVPLILSLLKPDSQEFSQSLDNLQQDSLYGPTGLQFSEETGASISTNFLLLRSLKRYKALSGRSQEKALQLYSHLKNSLIAAVARSNRMEKSFYGMFDKKMRPLGKKGSLEGTLVLPIMAELQKIQ